MVAVVFLFFSSCKKTKNNSNSDSSEPALFSFDFNNQSTLNGGTSKLPFSIEGNPVFDTDHNGNAKSALSLDGINDFINIPHGTDIDFEAVTVSAWIKPTNFGYYDNGITNSNAYSGFVAKSPNFNLPTFPGFTTSANVANIRITAELQDNTRGDCPVNQSLKLNQWVHIAYSIGEGRYNVYINGKLSKSVNYSTNSTLMKNTNPLTIGQVKWFPADTPLVSYFTGLLDDVKIYSKLLSDSQISTIYSNSRP